MIDIFNHTILCQKCNVPLEKVMMIRDGFQMRALVCPSGHEKIIHPQDEEEYQRFKQLRQKEFKVKMRIVGNSHTISIPKEIVSFMQEQEKIMNDMVRLCFEESGRVSLTFKEPKEKWKKKKSNWK